VRAEALARRGERPAALEFASQAVAIASATDALLDHAEARLAFAVALRAAGRAAEAAAEEQRARELWATKGASLLVEPSVADDARSAPSAPAPASAPSAPAPAATRRRVHPNRASASLEAFAAAVDARDAAGLEAWFTDDSVTVEHATGVTLGSREQRASWLGVLRAEEHSHRLELLASLGESLAIAHQWLSLANQRGAGFESFGEAEIEKLVLLERHPTRPQRIEIFAADRLGQALQHMYELYAEEQPAGPERARAEETARSLGEFVGEFDFDRFKTRFAPDIEVVDHRTIGFGSFRGAERLVEAIEALLELTDGWDNPVDDVLATTEHALLIRWTNSGTDRSSGGRFERPLLELWVFGEDGLLARWERFEPGHEREALARFDALVGPTPSSQSDVAFANAAFRSWEKVKGAWARRDAGGFSALFAREYRSRDHRHHIHLDLDRENLLDFTRPLLDMALDSRLELLATRGSRLALA
jgi:ketosteroid isomerase-like protein